MVTFVAINNLSSYYKKKTNITIWKNENQCLQCFILYEVKVMTILALEILRMIMPSIITSRNKLFILKCTFTNLVFKKQYQSK